MRLMLMFSCVSMSFLMEKVVFAIPFEWFFPLTLPRYPRRAIISFYTSSVDYFLQSFFIFIMYFIRSVQKYWITIRRKNHGKYLISKNTQIRSPMKWIIYSWQAIMTDKLVKKITLFFNYNHHGSARTELNSADIRLNWSSHYIFASEEIIGVLFVDANSALVQFKHNQHGV